MPLPATTTVLVHGASHSKSCWAPTVAAMAHQAPDARVVAVDLPGHGGEPGDLATLTIGQCVDSVVRQIIEARAERVLLVGHSMAGITIPGVASKLGPEVVSRLVFLACCVPPEGGTVLSTLNPPVSLAAGMLARRPVTKPLPRPLARWMFTNGMTRAQRRFVLDSLCAESGAVSREPVDRADLPDIPITWVMTKRDRSLRPQQQQRFIHNLGGVDEVVPLDTAHDAMVSAPDALASILLARL